jgi:phosphopantothenoylcysteine decarboxylase / phosphopantothenate---cysteine ligase
MKILITAGPTRERIDAVRFISNRSTGKMGYAMAEAAVEAGHEVTLISGPTALPVPGFVMFVPVESAADMAEAVKEHGEEADAIIMTAAVADYRPIEIKVGKIKKSDADMVLQLERTEDILAGLGANHRPEQILVGFAAETENIEQYALDKLKRKKLNYIVANDVSKTDRGFGSDDNAVILFHADGQQHNIPLGSKKSIAQTLIKLIFN